MKLAVIGGDARQKYCADLLAQRGHTVTAFRPEGKIPPAVTAAESPESAVRDADAVLLPIPLTGGNGCIVGAGSLSPETLLSMLGRGTHLLGGNISATLTAAARRREIHTHDYLDLESFVLRNAYLTAQGALGILLSELPVCLYRTPVAIIGFGRIAKFLSRMLVSLGAEVTVFARKPYDRAMASLIGMHAAPTERLSEEETLTFARIIINTAPARLLSPGTVAALAADTLLLELASGTDNLPRPDETSGVRLLFAHNLPGKCFPRSAGEIVADATEEFLA